MVSVQVPSEPCMVNIRSEISARRYVIERSYASADGPQHFPVRMFEWGGLITRYQAWCAAFDCAHHLAGKPNSSIGDLDGGRGWHRSL